MMEVSFYSIQEARTHSFALANEFDWMSEAFLKINLQSGQGIKARLGKFDKKIDIAFRVLLVPGKRAEKADAQQPEMLLEVGLFISDDGEDLVTIHGIFLDGSMRQCRTLISSAFGINFLMAARSLRSLDRRRQYPADLAGYHCRCPSGKFKTICSFNLIREAMAIRVRPGRPDSMSACVERTQ
jgi:hypothetical protein